MLERNWRNNRLFCHIFVISEITIRGGLPPSPCLRLCSNWGKQKRCSQIFCEVSGVFQRNFNCSKIVLSSSRGQGNFRGLEASRPRPRTSKCVLEDSTFVISRGRPRGLHLCYFVWNLMQFQFPKNIDLWEFFLAENMVKTSKIWTPFKWPECRKNCLRRFRNQYFCVHIQSSGTAREAKRASTPPPSTSHLENFAVTYKDLNVFGTSPVY